MDPEELRADTPALEEVVYLNTGAGSPSPRRVVEAVQSEAAYHEYEAPLGPGTYGALFEALDETRETVAAHVSATPSDIALTQSTADGIGRIAGAMDWEPGDVVVRTDQEHPAGILPWQHLSETRGVEVRVVEAAGGSVDRDAWRDAVSDAKLAVFSSLCWTDGCRLPTAKLTGIAQDAGARVLVDAVQSVGQRPVDFEAWGADAVAAAGHKWLLGPTGTGFLYVDDEFARTLDPAAVGYKGVEDPSADPCELKPDARRFEVGSVSPVPYAGLREGIAVVEEIGFETIESRVERLTDRLKDGLPAGSLYSPQAYESGLVSFTVDDADATVERLADAGIQIRALPLEDTVRASVHVFNTAGDVDALLDAL
jgi:selenocysteine lyase/cysteine desulfurase